MRIFNPFPDPGISHGRPLARRDRPRGRRGRPRALPDPPDAPPGPPKHKDQSYSCKFLRILLFFRTSRPWRALCSKTSLEDGQPDNVHWVWPDGDARAAVHSSDRVHGRDPVRPKRRRRSGTQLHARRSISTRRRATNRGESQKSRAEGPMVSVWSQWSRPSSPCTRLAAA